MRVHDQVYIPAAAHFQGAAGTFISDVYISNLAAEPVSVSVIYQPINSGATPGQPVGTEFKDVIKLRPFEPSCPTPPSGSRGRRRTRSG